MSLMNPGSNDETIPEDDTSEESCSCPTPLISSVNISVKGTNIIGEPIYPDLTPNFISEDDISIKQEGNENDININVFMDEETFQKELMLSQKEYEKHQKIFNPKKHKDKKKDIKKYNYTEPYPVDTKILELESHSPNVFIPKIEMRQNVFHFMDKKIGESTSENLGQLSEIIIDLSAKLEKRLSQLENVTSTLSRYLFRTASRMNINCVYYSGQNTFDKYKTIRCSHPKNAINSNNDDYGINSVNVTLDQCLNCPMYEPVIGQIYDILDTQGVNLSAILDDNQAQFSDMNDFITNSRIEEFYTPKKDADLTKNPVKIELKEEQLRFNMDWTETPLINQECNQGEKVKNYIYTRGETTYSSSDNNYSIPNNSNNISNTEDVIIEGEYSNGKIEAVPLDLNPLKQIGQVDDDLIKKIVADGERYANSNVALTVNNMQKYGYKNNLIKISNEMGIDPYLTLAIITVESGGNPNDSSGSFVGLMQIPSKYGTDPATNIRRGLQIYKDKIKVLGTNNKVAALTAYNCGEGVILGASSIQIPPMFENWKEVRNNLVWKELILPLRAQIEQYFPSYSVWEKSTYYPRILSSYNKLLTMSVFGVSNTVSLNDATSYDNQFRFPIKKADLSSVVFTSDFGPRGTGWHSGIDLAPIHTRLDEGPVVVLAAEEGTVISLGNQVGTAGYYIKIQHDSYYTLYMHLEKDSFKVKKGDTVLKGQELGNIGATGHIISTSTSKWAGYHLHFEVRTLNSRQGIDPKQFFRGLSSKLYKNL